MSDDAVTQPGVHPDTADPRVRSAVAVELQTLAMRDLDRQVDANTAVVRPFARLAEAGAALLEQVVACLGGVGGVLRGVWGGPIVALLVALIAATTLDTCGWGPQQIGAWSSETIRAVRCDTPAPPHTDTEGAVEAPAPAPR